MILIIINGWALQWFKKLMQNMHSLTCIKTRIHVKSGIEMSTVMCFQHYFRIWYQYERTDYTWTDSWLFSDCTLLLLLVWVERVLICAEVLLTHQFVIRTVKSATWILSVLHFDCEDESSLMCLSRRDYLLGHCPVCVCVCVCYKHYKQKMRLIC